MATINLGARPRPVGQQLAMSATAPTTPAARIADFLHDPTAPARGRHLTRRARGARRALQHAFVQVVAALAVVGLTLITLVRDWTMHVATAGSFVIAGFTVTPALGWAVLGLALLWTQSMIGKGGTRE